jgi:hypothetical protein
MVFQYYDKMTHVKTYNYEDLCDRIDRWKMFYIEQYQVQPGQTVLIDFSIMTIDYFASVFAAAELGLVLVNGVPAAWRKQNGKDTDAIPVVTEQVDYVLDFDTKSEWDHQLYAALSNNIVPNAYWQDYQVKDTAQLSTVKDDIRCTDDSVLSWDLSTGTRATHKKISVLSQRLGTILGYNKDSSILHTRNLHLLDFNFCWSFLPGFINCREHFVFNDVDVPPVIDFHHYRPGAPSNDDYSCLLSEFIMDNRINFVSLGHAVPGVLINLLKEIGTVDFDLTINTTAPVTREIVKLLREKNIAGINRVFCTSSRNAGMLVRQVTKDTPDNRLQMNNFGAPADDFFQFRLDNNTLYYSCLAVDEGWQTDGHQFILSNGEYHFAG